MEWDDYDDDEQPAKPSSYVHGCNGKVSECVTFRNGKRFIKEENI